VQSLDRLLIGSIKHAIASPLSLSHSAVALAIGLTLPSWLETSAKVSEVFLRMNSCDSRWSSLGRMLMREQCPARVNSESFRGRTNSATRLQRAAKLAVMQLGWCLQQDTHHRPGSRRCHLLNVDAGPGLPRLSEQYSSMSAISIDGDSLRLVHDLWSGWGAAPPIKQLSLDVYTDGSFDRSSSSSSWAVVIGDDWFDDNFTSVPIDESHIRALDVRGATMIGASIHSTQGVYPAELQAIARALAMLPASAAIHIHSDSRSSLEAIYAYEQQLNERKRLRMSARPILQLIHRQLRSREAAGGSVTLSHVKAHTDGADRHSVGNRIADYHANISRANSDRSYPLNLRELPLAALENSLCISTEGCQQIINDVRRSALDVLRQNALTHWRAHAHQGAVASAGVIELGRVVMTHGSPAEQSTFVHVATNSITRR
jgi:ribonuclease HI